MIIFLYGKDSYRRSEKLKELVSQYREKYGSAVDVENFDLEDSPDDWERVKDFLSQPSMFVPKKLAVVKEGAAVDKADWVKALKVYLKTEDVFIIISHSKKPAARFEFLLKPPVKSQEFEELEGRKLNQFLEKEAVQLGLKFQPAAMRFLNNYIVSKDEKSAWTVQTLWKIKCACLGQPVSLGALEELIPWQKEEKILFATRKFLNTKDKKEKLLQLEELLSRGEAADYIFNLIAYQAEGKTAEKLAEYDVMRKSGKLDYEECLLDLVLAA